MDDAISQLEIRGVYTKLPKFLWQSAEDVVSKSLKKLAARRKSLVTTGWINIVFVIIYRIMHIFSF